MKRLLMLLLVASLGIAAAPARAASRSELIGRVESCEGILREFMANPRTAIPASVLHNAKGLLILDQFKAGFIIGVQGGYGVLMVRQSDDAWSLPVLVRAPGASFGLQAGANELDTIYVFMDDATPRMLFRQRFHIGVDAKAVAGPHAADAQAVTRPLISNPILVYARSTGLFAGATLKAAQIARDDSANSTLYQTTYTMPELLYSNWVQPPAEIKPLIDFVEQIAR